MIIQREITPHLIEMANQFPVVALMGPRQSGKTTLVKETFPGYAYVTLEDLDTRSGASEDPRKFFASYANQKGLIIDEIQEVPELFSYMQGIVDQLNKPGFFIITGSQNFLMYEKITQTLAGRIALLTLLPLSIDELQQAKKLPATLEQTLLKGFYPRLYMHAINPSVWYSNYIATYVERDVRQILAIGNLISFQKFLKLCAARIGNVVNFAELARDADISPNTAKSWLSVLETSYIIKLLHPYYQNFSKRIIKSPKLYFYDTGLACFLLGIQNSDDLFNHPLRGALFESFVISELFKYQYNQIKTPNIYFWRDIQGHEVDCIIEKSYKDLIPVEIKAGMTVIPSFFKGILQWQEILNRKDLSGFIVYAGPDDFQRSHGTIISWKNIKKLMKA